MKHGPSTLVGHACGSRLWVAPMGHPCGSLLWPAPVASPCDSPLWIAPVGCLWVTSKASRQECRCEVTADRVLPYLWIEDCMLVASEEATWGSVMAKQDLILPCSRGNSHLSC